MVLLFSLFFFGYFEEKLHLYSFAISFFVLLLFVLLMVLKPKMILGGGDIKYMMVVAIYLEPILFPMFLLITGIIQTLFLLYKQLYKKRRVAPMVPAMFLSVGIVELLHYFGFYL
jgi:Flp pilus assembly protein protease CpaA